MSNRRITNSIESIIIVVLLILFTASISLLIYEGSNTYSDVIDKNISQENARISFSFINMKVKQNDSLDKIELANNEMNDENMLVISHSGAEEGLKTYIYFYDGFLWECYTDLELDHSLSSEIVEISDLKFELDDLNKQIVTIITSDDNIQKQKTTIRSVILNDKGAKNE